MGTLITFYSYKGGIGRTMALANIATLLACWGKRVLIVDWDLEAPGVEHFFFKRRDLAEVREILENTPGVIVMDDVKKNIYPMPILSHGRDEVFVGRIRRDETQPKTLNMWVVADNLRKGAATNAVQIAEFMLEKNLVY